MLLDVYNLKRGFENLPSLGSNKKTATPTTYLKRVNQATSRIDPILKTLQVRPSPPEALVQAYLIHIADKSDNNFRKIIELKGLKKQESSQLLELFQAHRSSPKNDSLAQSSPVLTPLNVGSGPSAVPSGLGSLSHAASLSTSNLPGRFDPTNFGNALMTAARDGVDRFGSGAGTPSESRLTSPPPPTNRRALSPDTQVNASTGNLNENLRNIGKFFKVTNNIGGFGGRFGRGEDA